MQIFTSFEVGNGSQQLLVMLGTMSEDDICTYSQNGS